MSGSRVEIRPGRVYVAPVGTTDWRELGTVEPVDLSSPDVTYAWAVVESFSDETHGMTIDELLGEIDDVLDSHN